jgi:hypothetical protein
MIDISDVEIYRDGGTLEFRVSGSEVDGFYRLQTPVKGIPEPLFRDEVKLPCGGAEEGKILLVLEQWLTDSITPDAGTALAELEKMRLWLNLPDRLREVVPLYYIRSVAKRLRDRKKDSD